MEDDGLLRKLYYDLDSPAAFSGKDVLLREGRKQDKTLTSTRVARFLQAQDAHTLQRTARRKFSRNPIVCDGPGLWLMSDLLDMSNVAASNDSVHFILSVLDCFTRKAYVRVLPNKTGQAVTEAFRHVLDTNRLNNVRFVNTDKGREYYNQHFQRLLSERNIRHYTTSNYKAYRVERFHRSLRELLGRYLTEKESDRYVDVLQPIVALYNRRYNRSLRMSPNEAEKEKNHFKVYAASLISGEPKGKSPASLNVGDTVRISLARLEPNIFRKTSWQPNFTQAYYTVRRVDNKSKKPQYALNDSSGKPIAGRFYAEELIPFTNKGVYKIERILRTRIRGGKKQLFVHWLGYPAEDRAWIDENAVVRDYTTKK